MSNIVIYPDVQFDGPLDIEATALGESLTIRSCRPGALNSISATDWKQAVAVVCYHDVRIDDAFLNRLESCKVIVRAGVGYDNVNLQACANRGIAVCNTPDYGTTEVADHTIAMMLALLRGIVIFNSQLRLNIAEGWDFRKAPLVRRLSSQYLGVVGLGRIGTATALRARALGLRVGFYDPFRPTGIELALGLERFQTLGELLIQSDVVSLHTPLSAETQNMISDEAFMKMKRSAILINTARGAVVDLDALGRAMAQNRIAGAALDVLPTEPATTDHPLISSWLKNEGGLADKLILSPHSAFYSPSSARDLRHKSALTAMRFLTEGTSIDCVNSHMLKISVGGSHASKAR